MMHAIALAVASHLRSVQCPIPVVDGPEPTESTTASRERVVIERAPDSFGPPRSQHRNPRHHYVRMVGAKVTIYAQSTKPGAMNHEHEERADAILAPVLVGLRYAAAARRVPLAVKGGQFVPIADLAKGAQPGAKGAKYELEFSVGTAITETTFAGEAAPEATVGTNGLSIGSTTQVSLANGPEGDDAPAPVVACGGA